MSHSDAYLVSGCYKTKSTSYALATAVLSRKNSQVFVISLISLDGCKTVQSCLIVQLDSDEKSSDRVKLEFGATPSALLQRFSAHWVSGPHVTIFHPINYTHTLPLAIIDVRVA